MATDPTRRLRSALQLAMLADNDHEALAALRAARRWLERHGRDVHWLVDSIGSIQPRLPPPINKAPETPLEAARWLMERNGYLNDKEYGFIEQILNKGPRGGLSARQMNYLGGIYRRVKVVASINPQGATNVQP